MEFKRCPFDLQIKTQSKITRDQVVIQFGNGYEEILNKDPHGELKEYSVTYTQLSSNMLSIISFLKEHSNGRPFLITDPFDKKDVAVYIKGGSYSISKNNTSQSTISFNLIESRRYAN